MRCTAAACFLVRGRSGPIWKPKPKKRKKKKAKTKRYRPRNDRIKTPFYYWCHLSPVLIYSDRWFILYFLINYVVIVVLFVVKVNQSSFSCFILIIIIIISAFTNGAAINPCLSLLVEYIYVYVIFNPLIIMTPHLLLLLLLRLLTTNKRVLAIYLTLFN